ncbi:fibronectin type III domain-containing protein [Saccharothrix texasensis]|uniref:Fibronectin type-III domain-containing protein n=1 Tax=Saccharothrix texasensis TaxID=103734 RepID=A0A3N1H9C7_9PSEU|nr:fibronectin type III domain-containing protein [Saccharothrix texasensis]ROP39119.1 hypothetical protein EDD40_4494 [Saccharothrix texasensis]
MERRSLIAALGGLALLGGAVVVLRDESAPPRPQAFERFLDERVEYVPDTQRVATPTDLRLTALDRTSLRASWTAADGIGHGGFEVRWNGETRLVRGTGTELTDLDANADTTVEVRALDALGGRSDPATAKAVPRLAYDDTWLDGLMVPLDLFDGPEALDPRRWRVFDRGDTDCLHLRPVNGERLEVDCDRVDLQSNVPLRFGPPAPDGAVARVSLTTDGPVGDLTDESAVLIALLPEPVQDLGHLEEPFPPGVLVLRITPFGARFLLGGAPLGETSGTYPPPTSGVRHRWELRVLPGSVVASRDGVDVASAPVELPWTSARARLAFRQARGTHLDTFGLGGVPGTPAPGSVAPLGVSGTDSGGVSLGNVANSQLAGASSVRVVASVVAERAAPITVELGTRSAPAVFMPPDRGLDPARPAVVHADFPLPSPDSNPQVRVSSDGGLSVYAAHLVIADGPDARHPLPRLVTRPLPDPRVPSPAVSAVHETAGEPADRLPDRGRLRLTVELADTRAREVAAVKGVEVDLDGERIAVLPTNGSAGGRHGFLVDLDGLAGDRHELDVRVVPVDERHDVQSYQQPFEIRPL